MVGLKRNVFEGELLAIRRNDFENHRESTLSEHASLAGYERIVVNAPLQKLVGRSHGANRFFLMLSMRVQRGSNEFRSSVGTHLNRQIPTQWPQRCSPRLCRRKHKVCTCACVVVLSRVIAAARRR